MNEQVEEPNNEEGVVADIPRTEAEIAENLYGDKQEKTEEAADKREDESGKEELSQQEEVKTSEESENQESKEREETVDGEESKEIVLELSKDSPLDDSYVEAVKKWAEDNDKSPEEAKEALLLKEGAVLDYIADQEEKVNLEAEKWVKDVASDPVLGGDNFEKSQAIARKPLNDTRFVSEADRPELIEFLNKSKLDSHPIFFKMLHAMGSAMSNDAYIKATQPPKRKTTMEERFYGDKATQ